MPQVIAQNLRTQIRQEVLDRILDGRLPQLAPIRHAVVATELGVSVTPLREALIELAREGFLEAQPNRGFFVAPFRAEELRDLYDLIGLLEVAALRQSPPSAAHLDVLEALNLDLAEAESDPWRAVQLDIEWHRELLADAPNEIGKGVLAGLKTRAMRYAYAYLREVGRIPRSVEQHATILTRLRDGDVEGAVEALEENWRPRVMLRWVAEYDRGERLQEARSGVALKPPRRAAAAAPGAPRPPGPPPPPAARPPPPPPAP